MGQSILNVGASTTIALGDAGTLKADGTMWRNLKHTKNVQLIATGTITFEVYGANKDDTTKAALISTIVLTDESKVYDLAAFPEYINIAITASTGQPEALLGIDYA